MLYSLFLSLVENYTFLNVFKYLTVRTGLAMFTSMVVVFFIIQLTKGIPKHTIRTSNNELQFSYYLYIVNQNN